MKRSFTTAAAVAFVLAGLPGLSSCAPDQPPCASVQVTGQKRVVGSAEGGNPLTLYRVEIVPNLAFGRPTSVVGDEGLRAERSDLTGSDRQAAWLQPGAHTLVFEGGGGGGCDPNFWVLPPT